MTEAKEDREHQNRIQATKIKELEKFKAIGTELHQQGILSAGGGLTEKAKSKFINEGQPAPGMKNEDVSMLHSPVKDQIQEQEAGGKKKAGAKTQWIAPAGKDTKISEKYLTQSDNENGDVSKARPSLYQFLTGSGSRDDPDTINSNRATPA